MAIDVKKVDNETKVDVSTAYYAATEITLSCRERIANLLANAKAKTVEVTSTTVKFKCAKGQLSYIVPLKFLTSAQKEAVAVFVKIQQKHKK